MNLKNILTLLKVCLKDAFLLLFVSLVLSVSSNSFLKAQSPSPAPQAPSVKSSGPLATTESEQNPDVRLEIRELKCTSGETLTLKFLIINDSIEKFKVADTMGGLVYGYNVSGVNLVDAAGKKKYQVVTDSEKNCLCSSNIPYDMEPNSRLNLWAKFPTPPQNVQNITVVVPHFIPMEDVPIS